jgi:hypothetical protein
MKQGFFVLIGILEVRAGKSFHDRARAGKLSSERGLFWCAMQRIVPEPVKGFMIGREQAN